MTSAAQSQPRLLKRRFDAIPQDAARPEFPGVGIYIYGLGGIVLGLTGLVWRDFATNWQHVGRGVPFREGLALITAVCEVLAGAAMFWKRTARMGAATLTALFAVFTALWLVEALKAPQIFDSWGNVFEELSGFAGGAMAIALLSPPGAEWRRRVGLISRIYGVCPISFGVEHLLFLSGVASWVPAWLPPGQRFWAGATGVFFLMAAAAILSGIQAGLAARLLTAQIGGFHVLIWMPKMFTAPHQQMTWAGNAISLALTAGAWVVADGICESRRAAGATQREAV